MRDKMRISVILSTVGNVLLSKGDGYSIGQLVAETEGDGMTEETDPFHVRDRHFQQDISEIDGWRDEPRNIAETEELLDTFEEYWERHQDLRFCQIVCNANLSMNGLGSFQKDSTSYGKPINELTDEQLKEYLEEGIRVAKKREENE